MKLTDFHYDLPKELIAQTPLSDRAASRMMTVDRRTGEIGHSVFRELPFLLRPGDCLVMNDTKVIPARLNGKKDGTGAKAELLLLNRLEGDKWEVLVRPGKRLKPGDRVVFSEGVMSAKILETLENGNRAAEFSYEGLFEAALDRLGEMPLPPYIREKLEDKNRYQTVYARREGSAAAPTAGLHFTEAVLAEIGGRGVETARLTLHVGLGTFRPVKAGNIEDHHMHSEAFSIGAEACDKINNARRNGGRIIAVGTTSCRVLETIAGADGLMSPHNGKTDIFIYPGYKFRAIDGLITNFHLPESTLLMLVSAFSSREIMLRAYEEAIRERYRFFSFGDCMLIY